MSESAATCFLNSVARSPIGFINLNEERLNQFFNVTGVKFDTSSFARHIPLFKDKLGPNKPLKVMTSVSHIEVQLGQFDADVIVSYTLHTGWFMDLLGAKELLYDEVRFVTKASIKTENDKVNMKVLDHKMNMDSKFGGKQLPLRNGMKLTRNEYREYLSELE